ncbi:MAG: translocation/assembly module TamB domain-containing protein [Acidobacteriota bacterium]
MARRPIPTLPQLTLTQVRLVRLFSLLLLFSVLVLYAVFRSHRFQDAMRRKTERLLEAQIGRKVSIGGFDLALLPFSFLVRDVSIANDRRSLAGPLFSASEIEIRGIPAITSTRIELSKLRVVAPRLVIEVFPDGSTNVDPILRALRGGGGGGKDIQLHEAVIQRASLRFREWKAEIDALLKDAAVTARAGRTLSVTHLVLACRQGSFRLEDNEPLEFAVGAEVTLAPGRAHLTVLRLKGPKISVEASGGVDDLKKPVLALVAKIETTGETLGSAFGFGLPLAGPVRLNGTLRAGDPGGFRIRAAFDLPASRLAVFPMSGEGTLRLDPKGLLVDVSRASYAGGSLQALVQLERLDRPPLPVKIALRGKGIDFEQFFADIGLPGTGMMARAALEATLTFGPGGVEHADGAGRLTLTSDPGRASAVKGRIPIPVSGGGPLRIRDGRILFDKLPLATSGGAKVRLDGSLRFGSWEPDLTFDVTAGDLGEVERLAANWYPAIQKEPLEPPLKLGGSGRISARLTRAFSDPQVEGRVEATDFVLRGVRFGETTASFTVDHNVATLAPFVARDDGGTLALEGKIGFGGALHGQYRLDGLVGEFHEWPLEKVLAFLDFDLPLSGRATGKLPLDGVTPAIHGRIPLVLTDASIWGQKLDRLEGVLAFQDDRISVEGATGRLGGATASFGGFYRYADGAYKFDLDAKDLPVGRLSALSDVPAGGVLTGRASGEGLIEKPTLSADLRVAAATFDGQPLARADHTVEIRARADRGVWSLRAEAADEGVLEILSPKDADAGGRWRVRAELPSLAPLAGLLGVPAGAKFDGRLSAEAFLKPGASSADLEGEGAIAAAQFTAWGRTLTLRGTTPLKVAGGRVSFERLALAEAVRPELPSGVPTLVTLSGSAQFVAPRSLDVSANGSVDASLLEPAFAPLKLAGRVTLDARLGGTASAPVVTGRAALDGVDVVSPDGGLTMESATGSLLFSEGKVTISDLSVRYGGGTVDVGGSLLLDGWKPVGMRVTALVSRVKASPFDGFRATLSGNVLLLGDSQPRAVRGELTIDRALFDRDFSIDLAALLQRKRVATVGVNPTFFDPVTLDVRLVAPPESIEVRTNVARLKASGELFARGTWGHPLLFGEIRAEEGGRLTLQGQRYDLVSGRILFSNPIRIEPFFEMEARGTVNKYQVTFGLTGTAARLATRFSSDPQLSEAQIITLMATGDVPSTSVAGGIGATPASSDESVSRAARELLASLASNAVTSRTKEFFRLDRFQIDPAFSTGSTFDAPRITVGKSLGRDFNATVSFVLSSNQQQIITLDYQLSPTAFLQARLDEFGVYSLELRFRQRLR